MSRSVLRSLSLAALLASPVTLPRPAAAVDYRTVPEWAKSAVWYQIFPERFRNGDPKNDPTRDTLEYPIKPSEQWKPMPWTADWYARADWEVALGPDFYRDGVFDRRYGGDLQGVLDRLAYLEDLGVTAIYFNPIFHSRSLHKYDGSTFHHVDVHFGPDPQADLLQMARETGDPKTWGWTSADKLFLELVKQAKARGIRIVIDGVFNHTGRDFFAFRDLRKQQRESPYKAWYDVEEFDDPETRRNEFRYKGWWGHASLPEFADAPGGKDLHPGPKAYIFAATARWMDPNGDGDPSDGVDGWRLDVADEVPIGFWADWNRHVRKLNPDAYTVAEIWKNPAEFIRDGGFSASMNYFSFAMPVKAFFVDGRLDGAAFGAMLDRRRSALDPSVAAVMQNLMDSHDTDRLASMILNPAREAYDPEQIPWDRDNSARSSKTYLIGKPTAAARAIQRMIALMQMSYVGAPMIYYGTEAGMWSGDDPDDRMPMVWQDLTFAPQAIDPRGTARVPDDVNFDPSVFSFYKQVIALRRDYRALNTGTFAVAPVSGGPGLFAFLREAGDQRLLVVFNRDRSDASASVELPEASAAAFAQPEVVFTTADAPDAVAVSAAGRSVAVRLPALTGAVVRAAPRPAATNGRSSE